VRADLHTHSVCSDGTLSPEALIALAADHGVGLLALTDHDTVDGVPEAIAAGRGRGLRVVPGVELSVAVPSGSMHLLGYFAEPAPPELMERLATLRTGRLRRAEKIVGRLADLGAPVELERVVAHARGPVGRPHIAAELVSAGHVATHRQAFERFLGDGGPAWVPSTGLGPEEAVALVRASGGVAALAHPYSLRLDRPRLDRCVARLARAGLAGIEVHRPEHDAERRREYARLARRHGLVATGGSDFHRLDGLGRPGDTGDPPLPVDAIDRMFATAGA
jgi:3',5'-nucleoside bisphosphate phosphatase